MQFHRGIFRVFLIENPAGFRNHKIAALARHHTAEQQDMGDRIIHGIIGQRVAEINADGTVDVPGRFPALLHLLLDHLELFGGRQALI